MWDELELEFTFCNSHTEPVGSLCIKLFSYGQERQAHEPWCINPVRKRRCAVLRMFSHDSFSLTGTSWDLNNTAVKQEHMSGPSDDSTSSRVSHMFLF